MTHTMNNKNELDHRTDMLPVVVARGEGDGGHIFQCCWKYANKLCIRDLLYSGWGREFGIPPHVKHLRTLMKEIFCSL